MTTVSTPRKIATTATTGAALTKGSLTPVDATSGALTMTLPTTAAVGVEVSVEKVDTSTNAVTVTGTLRGVAAQSITLTSQYEARTFLSEGSGSWRPVADHRTATSLASAFVSAFVVIADTTGAADATAAIQAKIDAAAAGANGGLVYIPAGSYKLLTELVPKARVAVVGAGRNLTRLLPYGTAAGFKRIGSSVDLLDDFQISDLTIDGSNQAGTYSTSMKAIYIQYLRRCAFRRLRVYNTAATGVGSDFHVDCVMDDIIADSCGRLNDGSQGGGAGIGVGTGSFTTETLTVSNCVTVRNKRCGLFFETQNGGLSVGTRVVNHYSEANGEHGIADAGCSDLVVSNSHCYNNTRSGFASYGGTINPGKPGTNAVVTGCSFFGNQEHGVHYDATVRGTTNPRLMVRACRMRSNQMFGVSIDAGSTLECQGITIADNEIHGNSRSGIVVTTAGALVTDLSLEGNKVFNNGTNTGAAERQGIRIAASTTRLNLRNNRCFDSQATQTQTYGIQLNGGTTATEANVVGNDVRKNLTGGLQPSGTLTSSIIGSNPGYTSGAGTPEGVVIAPVGTQFIRTDGGAGTTLYIKETGTGNTGWVGK